MKDIAGNFSGGQQQMLAIARGLMAKPKILVLDEPSLGVAPLLVAEIFRLIVALREQGITILLAEQNARQALSIADRGYVFEQGRITLSGAAKELLNSPDIAERYLGMSGATEASDAAGTCACCETASGDVSTTRTRSKLDEISCHVRAEARIQSS